MRGRGPVTGLVGGFLLPIEGLRLVMATPRARRWLYLALLGNLLVVSVLIATGWWAWSTWGWEAVESVTWSWLADVAGILAILLLLALTLLLLPVLVPIVASPFFDPLARAVEESLLGRPAPESPHGFWGTLARDLNTALKLILFELLLVVVTLAASPFAMGVPVALLLGSWLAALTWVDYPLARRGLNWREKKAWVGAHLLPCLGFGLAVCLSFLIPVYNLLLAGPAAVAGATSLFVRLGGARERG